MNGHQTTRGLFRLGPRYPQQIAWIRVAVGIWLLFLTTVFYGTGHGGQWAWLLVVLAALHFVLAGRLFRIARNNPDRRMTVR
jgi:hypothetical protein